MRGRPLPTVPRLARASLAALLCGWLALGLAACGQAPAATSGATLATRHWRIAVTSVQRQATLAWNRHGGEQGAVGEWLLVAIDLTNLGRENFGVNRWDFAVRDGAGNTYQHANGWVALTHPERLGYAPAANRQVPPGLTLPVLLVFDVAPAAAPLELVFNQDGRPRVALPGR